MTSSLMQPIILSSHPKFRPYASAKHQVAKGRYITSNDPRGYIPVYEYPLNGQWIMMDVDDGYILWTGIWKALGNSKGIPTPPQADIVKMIDSQPDLAPLIRRVRGGYLKIQGTWMPYEVALRLSRRVAWAIREDLIPLFGPTFPNTCLSPDQPGYGQVVFPGNGRRRSRRPPQPSATTPQVPPQAPRESNNTSWAAPAPQSENSAPDISHRASALGSSASFNHGYHSHHHADRYHHPSPMAGPPTSVSFRDPQPTSVGHQHVSYPRPSMSSGKPFELDRIILPPLRELPATYEPRNVSHALPPISAFEDMRGTGNNDSAAVLRRLRSDNEPPYSQPHSRAFNYSTYEKISPRSNSIAHHSYSSTDVSQCPGPLSVSSNSHGFYPYHDHRQYRQRTSRPPSRASSMSHLSYEGDYSAINSTCEPSPDSIVSSPRLSHCNREENTRIMTPLTLAADRMHLDLPDTTVQPPLRPW